MAATMKNYVKHRLYLAAERTAKTAVMTQLQSASVLRNKWERLSMTLWRVSPLSPVREWRSPGEGWRLKLLLTSWRDDYLWPITPVSAVSIHYYSKVT